MKRSDINRLIAEAQTFFAGHQFHLPAWADRSPGDWRGRGPECDEIRRNGLGWDLTDFGSGAFLKTGLLLFTIRNGNPKVPGCRKPYAEKIMVVREGQVTPMPPGPCLKEFLFEGSVVRHHLDRVELRFLDRRGLHGLRRLRRLRSGVRRRRRCDQRKRQQRTGREPRPQAEPGPHGQSHVIEHAVFPIRR